MGTVCLLYGLARHYPRGLRSCEPCSNAVRVQFSAWLPGMRVSQPAGWGRGGDWACHQCLRVYVETREISLLVIVGKAGIPRLDVWWRVISAGPPGHVIRQSHPRATAQVPHPQQGWRALVFLMCEDVFFTSVAQLRNVDGKLLWSTRA